MRECGFLCSPPALYKGARWGLSRPAQRIKAREEQGVGADPLPLLAFPASTVRDAKCMGAAWRRCRTEANVTHFLDLSIAHDLSQDAAIDACRYGRTRWIRSVFGLDPGRACPCPVLGLAQQRSAPCVAQARGLLSVY